MLVQMMMFSVPTEPYEINPVKVRALELFLILHMDHEQNASTSTVRNAGAQQSTILHGTRFSSAFKPLWADVQAVSPPLHNLARSWIAAGSSQANPYACIASGIATLWGPAHG